MANIPPTPDLLSQLESLMKALEAGSFPFSLSQLDNLEANSAVERKYGETDEQLRERLNPIKCECGKEKHGFATHSTWCKKWKQEA